MMCRFAVLCHDSPRGVHWDFLLEMGAGLRTWALPQPPESGVEMVCRALPDHRLVYLDYEGPVSGERGSVRRWERGTYRLDRQSDRELTVELSGEKLSGRAVLRKLPGESGRWRFSFTARQPPG
jgi:hypothetical protein